MGSAISSGTYAKPVKAMYSASIPIIRLHHGASRNGLSAPPRRSQRHSDDLTGGVCRPAPEPKDRDCTTGATSNWPIYGNIIENGAPKGERSERFEKALWHLASLGRSIEQ